jgi:hypothetical protein
MACSWTRNSCAGRVLNRKAVRSPPSTASPSASANEQRSFPRRVSRVYGLVFSLTRSELDRRYFASSVQACKPQAVLAQLASGGVATALCYNLRQPPSPTERNPEYAVKLRAVAQKVGLPAEDIASLR